jgi:hypothetical protein
MGESGAGLLGAMGIIGFLLLGFVILTVAILGFFLPVFVYITGRAIVLTKADCLFFCLQEVSQIDQKQARLLQAYQI